MDREKLTSLVQAAQGMDPEAMNALFEECRDPIYYFALRTAQDPQLAEDIAQEAMIDIFRNLDKLKDPAAFQAWSREITYRQCLHQMKKAGREVTLSEDEDGASLFDTLEEENQEFIPDAAMESQEFRQTIQNMIAQLPAEQRSAIMLYHFDELSVKQIAQIQQVSENTVKSRLMYGRKAIKSAVEGYEKRHGIKLHSFALLPFLGWLLAKEMVVMPASAAAATAAGVSAATGVTVGAAAATTAAGAAAAAGTAAKAAVPLAAKIAAGATAAAVAVGGVAVGLHLLNKEAPLEPLYRSSYLKIYGHSDTHQAVFQDVLGGGDVAQYILTQDGKVFTMEEDEDDVFAEEEVQEILCGEDVFGYRDKDGQAHLFADGEEYIFPELKGAPVFGRLGYHAYQVFTLHQGKLLSSVYDTEGKFVEKSNEPFGCFEGEDNAVDQIHFSTYYDLIDHQTVYFAARKDKQMVGAFTTYIPMDHNRHEQITLDGKPVKVTFMADNHYTADSPLFAVEGEEDKLYYVNFYGADLDEAIPLPEDYTVSALKQVIFGYTTYLLFDDGKVFSAKLGYQDPEFAEQKHLSEIGEHIVRMYLTDETREGELVVLMDDQVLYRYNPEGRKTASDPKDESPENS